jgi:hypothetical protein
MSTLTDLVGAATGNVNPVGAASSIVNGIKGLIGFFKVDETVKAQITEKLTEDNIDLEKLQLANEAAAAQGQLAINLQEAKNNRLFDDWRDAVGWTCAIALFWNSVGLSFLSALLIIVHPTFNLALLPPRLDMTQLLVLLGTMMGTGASQFHIGGNGA